MIDVDPGEERRLARWWLLGTPLVVFFITLGQIYVTLYVARCFAPGLLDPVAARPVTFAALIALVALPMHVVVVLAFAGRALKAILAGADPPTPPVRTRWRRFRSYLFGVLPDIVAALIVLKAIADLSTPLLGPLLAVTVLGPIALSWLIKGLGVSCRWGWRHWTNRGYRPRHVVPAERLTALDPSTPTSRRCYSSSDTDP